MPPPRPVPPRARLHRPNPHTVIAWAKMYPTWGTPFREADFIASLGASAPFTRVVAFRVPMGDLGLLEGFANGVANAADWDNLTWQVRINNTAIPGLDVIQGVVGYIPVTEPLAIPLMPNHLVEVMVRNNSIVAILNPAAAIIGRTFAPDDVPSDVIEGG